MNAAIFISIFAGLFAAICLLLFFSSDWQKKEQAKARARRLADAKMNARLLRLNL